jgi:hypothetical protein
MGASSRAGGPPRFRPPVLGLALLLACNPAREQSATAARIERPAVDAGGAGARAPRVPAAFPLRAAAGGRHLEDQSGAPFLIKGEAAWLALVNLTEAEQEIYLAERAGKGFNLVEVMLTNHDYTGPPNPEPPANRLGERPFRRAGDLSTPDDAYFDRAVAFVDRAAAHGIAVLLAPNYLGFDGGAEGWWQALNAPVNTREVCAAFGRYLGARFRDRRNVIWLAGGDFAPPPGSEGEARHAAIVEGIRAAGATQPWTGHWNRDHRGGISSDQRRLAPLMDLEGVYQYADTYRYAVRAYLVQPPRPVFLLESTYEHEHAGSENQPFRKAWWWTMLSGGSGVVWGNVFLWRAESIRGLHRADYADGDGAVSSWAAELDSPGTRQIAILHRFFEALPWHLLVPAGKSGVRGITSGQGLGPLHIAVAGTPQHDLVVAYVPPTGGDRRRFRLDLSDLAGAARARWLDPAGGGFREDREVAARAGEVEFQVPGRNAGGEDDWVLLIEPRR